jgi:hypothetical protein
VFIFDEVSKLSLLFISSIKKHGAALAHHSIQSTSSCHFDDN